MISGRARRNTVPPLASRAASTDTTHSSSTSQGHLARQEHLLRLFHEVEVDELVTLGGVVGVVEVGERLDHLFRRAGDAPAHGDVCRFADPEMGRGGWTCDLGVGVGMDEAGRTKHIEHCHRDQGRILVYGSAPACRARPPQAEATRQPVREMQAVCDPACWRTVGERRHTTDQYANAHTQPLQMPTLMIMTTDTTDARKTVRIEGTLHKPTHTQPVPRQDMNLPKEKAEEGEVAGRHKNSGQKDHKGAR